MRPVVTDHAVLRYLERTGCVDIKAVRRHIATMVLRGLVAGAKIGAGEFAIVVPGARFVVVDGRVVTTLDPATRQRKRRRRKGRR